MSSVGKRIAKQRKKLGLTQNELALKLMVSNKAVSKWESDMGNPSFEFLPMLCEILDCSADYLILGEHTFEHYKRIKSGVLVKLGTDSDGKEHYEDITKFPHLLAIGKTGSGKSCLFHSFIIDIIKTYSPEKVKLGLIDVKQVEFMLYKNLPHLMKPIALTIEDTIEVLETAMNEMARRYEMFQELKVKNIKKFNNISSEKLPFNILIIDELAEVIHNERAKELILHLYTYGRASGTYMIIGTQRLKRDTLPADWVNYFPARICFKVKLKEQSEEYFSIAGGEKLKEVGEFLFYKETNEELLKLQATYYSYKQIYDILKEKGWNNGEFNSKDDFLLKELNVLFKEDGMDVELELTEQFFNNEMKKFETGERKFDFRI